MTNGRPSVFEIYVGGFGGSSFGAWWDGAQVVYESFRDAYEAREQVIVKPSPAQWRRFWKTMDAIDVWSWKPWYGPGQRYEPPGVIRDGTHWSLTLRCDDRRADSGGDSAGPDALDLDESPQFTRLCEAVSRLLGGREFR